jgi:GNAT superfamily N-acetyltransferase
MAQEGVGAEPAGVIVRPAHDRELRAGARLLAESLGFGPPEAIPAWLMQTTGRHGGLSLVAVERRRLIGFSYAFAALDGEVPFLYSCGLAVAPDRRGDGVGRRLKLAQGTHAVRRGYRLVRWTADPLNAPALRLYLDGLGARLTAYHAGLHDGVREGDHMPQDDVEIEWPVPRARRAPLPTGGPAVELPWDRDGLSPAEALARRLEVRAAVTALLAQGRRGVSVEVDRAARRCRLVFGAP